MERLPTPVFWPGEFHGLYSPWGHKGSDMTEQLSLSVSLRVAGGSTAQVDQLCHTGLAGPLRILRNLYVGQEAMVRTGHGTTDLFQTGK